MGSFGVRSLTTMASMLYIHQWVRKMFSWIMVIIHRFGYNEEWIHFGAKSCGNVWSILAATWHLMSSLCYPICSVPQAYASLCAEGILSELLSLLSWPAEFNWPSSTSRLSGCPMLFRRATSRFFSSVHVTRPCTVKNRQVAMTTIVRGTVATKYTQMYPETSASPAWRFQLNIVILQKAWRYDDRN